MPMLEYMGYVLYSVLLLGSTYGILISAEEVHIWKRDPTLHYSLLGRFRSHSCTINHVYTLSPYN